MLERLPARAHNSASVRSMARSRKHWFFFAPPSVSHWCVRASSEEFVACFSFLSQRVQSVHVLFVLHPTIAPFTVSHFSPRSFTLFPHWDAMHVPVFLPGVRTQEDLLPQSRLRLHATVAEPLKEDPFHMTPAETRMMARPRTRTRRLGMGRGG